VKKALARFTRQSEIMRVSSSALELAGSLARGAPEVGLGKGFFATVAPPVFDCMRVVVQVPM
jgi:hypothetical protein